MSVTYSFTSLSLARTSLSFLNVIASASGKTRR